VGHTGGLLTPVFIFEAIGMQKQELRHSTFLAFLLDPQQPHGLGDDFLKKLLQRALLKTTSVVAPVKAIDLHLMDLNATVVEREWNNIDIFLLNEGTKQGNEEANLAVIIENKVETGEHDNQLDRYFQIVQRQYPACKILALYLTVDGSLPSHSSYLPLSYEDVASTVEAMTVSRETVLGPDVFTLMQHYVQMLRRNLVSDAELESLCRRIYAKHRRAIELIFKHIPNQPLLLMEFCQSFLDGDTRLKIHQKSRNYVAFIPVEWDVPALNFAPPNSYGVFQIYIRYFEKSGLLLYLSIRPGRKETRERLYEMAKTRPDLFPNLNRKLTPKYYRLFSKRIMPTSDLKSVDLPMLKTTLLQWIDEFLRQDLPKFQELLREQDWVWAPDAPYASDGDVLETGEEEEEDV